MLLVGQNEDEKEKKTDKKWCRHIWHFLMSPTADCSVFFGGKCDNGDDTTEHSPVGGGVVGETVNQNNLNNMICLPSLHLDYCY